MNIKSNIIKLFLIVLLTIEIIPADSTKVNRTDSTKNGKIVGVPFIYYSPETGLAGGGRLGYYWINKKSNVYTNVFISQKKQYELFFGGEIYYDVWKTNPKIKFSKWVDTYYGLGNHSKKDNKIDYDEKFFWLYLSVQRKINNIYGGMIIECRGEKTNIHLLNHLPGSWNWHTAGTGVILTYDTRDNIYYPSKGHYLETIYRYYIPFLNALSYSRLTIDYRYFNKINRKIIIALQMKSDFSSENIPIQVIPSAGDIIRGYEENRYKDKIALCSQLEGRIHIWRKISVVAFYGIGDVFRRLDDLSIKYIKVAGGIGLRYMVTEDKVNLRLDFAVNKDGGTAFYLDFGEAF